VCGRIPAWLGSAVGNALGTAPGYTQIGGPLLNVLAGPRKDGQDTLYPGVVEVDEDVREEYWLQIRERPDLVHEKSFRSIGKYTKRGRGAAEV
jgi:hypothetical protein